MYLTCAMLVLTLACGAIGTIAAARRTAPLASADAHLPPAPSSVHPVPGGAARFLPGNTPSLDRIAAAVDAAESNYGTNPRMMRADPDGPQGPMQLTAAAATDVGGGNRFDLTENLALGRAYLASMYRRYGSWADAVAAYNWGPGHMDAWVHDGRRTDRLPAAVARYTGQVLLASASPGVQLPDLNVKALSLPRHQPGPPSRETSRRAGIAGADGAPIPAGAGSIGMTPHARMSPRGKKHKKDVSARSYALPLQRPRAQARATVQAKASEAKRDGSSPGARRRLHDRVADIKGSRLIPAHPPRVRKTRPRQRAAHLSIPAGRKNVKTPTAGTLGAACDSSRRARQACFRAHGSRAGAAHSQTAHGLTPV